MLPYKMVVQEKERMNTGHVPLYCPRNQRKIKIKIKIKSRKIDKNKIK